MRFQVLLAASFSSLAIAQSRQDGALSVSNVLATTSNTIEFHSGQISNIVARMNIGDTLVKRTALESNLNEIKRSLIEADKLVPELRKVVVNGRKVATHQASRRDAVLDIGQIQGMLDTLTSRLSRAADVNPTLRSLSNEFTQTSNDALDSLFGSVYATQHSRRETLNGSEDSEAVPVEAVPVEAVPVEAEPVESSTVSNITSPLIDTVVGITKVVLATATTSKHLNIGLHIPGDGLTITTDDPSSLAKRATTTESESDLVKRITVPDIINNLNDTLAAVPFVGDSLVGLAKPFFESLAAAGPMVTVVPSKPGSQASTGPVVPACVIACNIPINVIGVTVDLPVALTL